VLPTPSESSSSALRISETCLRENSELKKKWMKRREEKKGK